MKASRIIHNAISFAIFVGAARSLPGQSTTNTNCTMYGNTANCTSTTTDQGAQQQRAYEQGREAGQAIGQGLAVAMQRHRFGKGLRKYCAAHPGEDWHYRSASDGRVISSGHCPSDEDRVLAVANEFAARHKDFKRDPENAKAMTTYIEAHNLDPREGKSYEQAYKYLKDAGQLDLYAKQ